MGEYLQDDDTTPEAQEEISRLEREIRDVEIQRGASIAGAVMGFATWATTTYFAVSCFPADEMDTPEKLVSVCAMVGVLSLRSLCLSVPIGAGIGSAGGYIYYRIGKKIHESYSAKKD